MLRKDTIKEIKGLSPALSVEEGGTGGKTQPDARKGLGFEDLGFGLASQPVLSVFDWQQFTFLSGASYAVNPAAWSNVPAGVVFHGSISSVFVSVIGAVNSGTFELLITPNTNTDANYKEFKVRVIGAKGARTFSVRQIFSSAESIPVSNGGTGGKTPEEGRRGLGFEDLGFGLASQLVSPPFDWQQADFAIGQTQLVNVTGWLNAPAELKNPAGDVVSIMCEVARNNANRFAVRVVSQALTATQRYEYYVVMSGAKGSRAFSVAQEFNSDPTTVIPVNNGGTGAKTPAEARANLELNTRIIAADKSINEIGPLQEGRWAKTTNGATLALGYPEDNAVGTLDVYAGGSYGGTQIFTARSGIAYVRFLTGNWNGKDGPWGEWGNSGEEIPYPDVWVPLSDDLRLLAGYAPQDKVTIGDQTIELPSKSMTFTRMSTGTYIDKSGVLQVAAINEPRFERDGLLLEGQSTNNMLNSEDPTKWSAYNTLDKSVLQDGSTQATTFKGTVNAVSTNHLVINSASLPCVVGDVFTLSARARATSDKIRIRFTIDGTETAQAFFNGVTGEFISASSSLNCSVTMQSDGYAYISVTYTPAAAGAVTGNIWFNGGTPIANGESIFVQTVQFEKNPVATSYIPTGASAVTRAADNLSLPANRNIGYRLVGDKFNRTLSFELTVDRFSPPSATYFDAVRGLNANNDIILRIMDASLRSYRSGGGPTIFINSPFARKTYVQTIDKADRVSLFVDSKTDNSVGGPTTATTSATSINFAAHPNVVYHVRNFRVWHRLLTAGQVRGLR